MIHDFKASMGLPSSYETVAALQRPRTIKTHLSYDMLPKQVHEKKQKYKQLLEEIDFTLFPTFIWTTL